MTAPTTPPSLAGLRRRLDNQHALNDRFGEQLVRDPRGGRSSITTLLDRHTRLHTAIDAEETTGSRRHHRISPGRRLQLRLLPVLDGLVLGWFLIGVLNIDLDHPGVLLLVAAVLALLGSLAIAAWNAAVGEHLRRWKDDGGDVEWSAVDGVGRGLLVASVLMWALLAAMMYVRIDDEIYQATGTRTPTGIVIALALAAAVVLVNAYVLILSFSDGSPSTAELDRLGRVLAPAYRRHEQARVKADQVQSRITARQHAYLRLAPSLPAVAEPARTEPADTRSALPSSAQALPTRDVGADLTERDEQRARPDKEM